MQWSQFFEIGGSKPNLSRRIGPKFSYALGSDKIFPAIDETNRVGLAYRDLMSSALAGLWSVDHLIEELRAPAPELINGLSQLAANREWRVRPCLRPLARRGAGLWPADARGHRHPVSGSAPCRSSAPFFEAAASIRRRKG